MDNLGTHKKAIATQENDNTASDKCPDEMGNSWTYLKNGKFVKTRKNIKVQCSKKGEKSVPSLLHHIIPMHTLEMNF